MDNCVCTVMKVAVVLLYIISGVRLSPLRTAATAGLLYQSGWWYISVDYPPI
jgi:hypothetical protein